MIRYTGDETDIATCYQFVMNDLEGYAALVRDFPFEPVPTPKGTCFKSFCGLGENCLDDFVCDFVDDGYRIDNPATDMIAAI
jgi:hypothetical protein